jgi:hypothetical protein
MEVRVGTLVNSVESKSEGSTEKEFESSFWRVVELNTSCETYVVCARPSRPKIERKVR